MKYRPLLLAALSALIVFTATTSRADNMASLAVAPSTGAVSLVPRWVVGGSLAGFHFMAQDLSLGGGPNQFYSLKGTAIPSGGDVSAFNLYIAASGATTAHADIGSKLTPNSYSALSSADPDLGFGSVQLYFIHHKNDGDYFSHLVPGSGTASGVADLKPMSQPGGPATGGASGYFGLTFSATDLGYGANLFYYLRTNSSTGFTKFGSLVPALAGSSTDQFDLGLGGHNALAYTGSDVGFGINQMYFLRLDPVTGFTIFGTLHPGTGRASDVANLGSVYSTLTYVPGNVGFGAGQFYTTGAVNPTWQSVSFAAISDRAISSGSFTVSPSASSGLAMTLTVVPGSIGAASITGPSAGVFTVTPTAPGRITLQATQGGQATVYEYNMLRQSFTATGVATLAITTQPTSQIAAIGSTANFSVTASGLTSLSYQWRKAGVAIGSNASALTSTLTLTNVQSSDAAVYDVVVTNSSGSLISDPVTLTATTAAPIVTNSPLTAGGTTGASFTFTIAASGSPTSFAASPLPAGLSINTTTGAITGTPTTAAITSVLISATNASGTGSATLTLTVSAAGTAPIVTNNPLSAAGTVGSAFNFSTTASGTPTSFSATPLPAGLSVSSSTGVISGTPTTVGTTFTVLGATNATGTGNATVTITVSAADVAPIVTNSSLTSPGTIGSPYSFTITASGSPASFSATGLPAGLTLNSQTGAINGTPTTSGTSLVTLTATNSAGASTVTLTITVAPAAVVPVITSPSTAPGTAGAVFPTYVIAGSGLPTSFSATGLPAGLTLNTQTGAINGTPTGSGTFVVTLFATNATGTTSTTLTLVIAAAPSSRIVNFSARALSGPGNETLIMGFVVSGDGKNLLVRGIGPTLAAFGLLNGLADPMLTLYGSSGVIATNDDWQTNLAGPSNSSLIASTAAGVGAFALGQGSKDSALLFTFNNGSHTTSMLRPNSTTGVGLTEIYDIDGTSTSRLINVSARMNVTTGEGTLIVGFVIAGNLSKTVLIRGSGPSLAAFGVGNVLPDPKITVFAGSTQVASNDNWEVGLSSAAEITSASSRVGAFPLAAGAKDAALLLTLQPGAYTVQVIGVGTPTGVALVEVYDAQ